MIRFCDICKSAIDVGQYLYLEYKYTYIKTLSSDIPRMNISTSVHHHRHHPSIHPPTVPLSSSSFTHTPPTQHCRRRHSHIHTFTTFTTLSSSSFTHSHIHHLHNIVVVVIHTYTTYTTLSSSSFTHTPPTQHCRRRHSHIHNTFTTFTTLSSSPTTPTPRTHRVFLP